LEKELKNLNKHLKELKNSGKHMIYSANPFKFGLYNFIAGIFHSLGALFGYLVIFGAIAFLFSQFNVNNLMSKWVENTLQNVNWNKVVPGVQPGMENIDQLQQKTLQQLDQQDLQQLKELEKQLQQ